MKPLNDTNSNASGKPKPYTSPRLTTYGHVKDIVQGSVGPMTGDGSSTTKPCWVAEALYGVDDARTALLRGWMSATHAQKRTGWRLISLYMRWGRDVARLIDRGCLPRYLVRPLFDFLTLRAFDASADGLVRASRRRV